MTDAEKLDELRRLSGTVSVLAARCQEDIRVSRRLPDGRVLVPNTAAQDMARLRLAQDRLLDLID